MPVPQGTIGPYTLEKLLGSGGMSEVYQAYDHRLQRRVAIKQLQNGSDADAGSRERFLHEARSVARLSHPSIIQIHDILEDESGDWIVMERIDGPTVAELVAQGPLPVARAVSIGRQVAEGLVEAHDQGILHRDLKSENVMLARGDRAKILDFGLAKRLWPGDGEASLSGQGRVLGTCRAMSPEQARDQTLDPRSDLFALGVLLYEMLTGQSPFHADNHTDTLTRVCHFHPPPVTDRHPEVPVELAALVDRLLQKDRQKRPQSAREVAEVLAALDAQLSPSGSGSASGPVVESGPIVPRQSITPGWVTESVYLNRLRASLPRRWLWWGAGGVAVALALVVALVMWMRNREAVPTIQVRPSVAVLGLDNRSGKEELNWVATGAPEAVNAELAAGGELRTVPSESVAQASRELGVPVGYTLSPATLSKLRSFLVVDWVVVGSFTELPGNAGVELTLYVQNVLTGQSTSLSRKSSPEGVLDLAHLMGAEIRSHLGGFASAEEVLSARATLPKTAAAARWYFEGMQKMLDHEFSQARALFELAVEAEPEFPLAWSELAEAHSALGFDAKAQGAAAEAVKWTEQLSLPDRLLVRARFHEMSRSWDKAIENYRNLWDDSKDQLDYGLQLARALAADAQVEEAMEVIAEMRGLASAVSDELRIDLVEAEVVASLSQYPRLLEIAEQAMARAEELGARTFTARASQYRAYALLRLGRPVEALAAAERARELHIKAGNPLGAALALNQIATVKYESGQILEALPIFEQVREDMMEIGHVLGISKAVNNIASCWTLQGKLAKAEPLILEAKDLADDIGDMQQGALVRIHLAELKRRRGDLEGAQEVIDEAIEMAEEAQHPYASNFAWLLQGYIHATAGDLVAAQEAIEKAHTDMLATKDPRYIGFSWEGLGVLERMLGDLLDSRESLEKARKLRSDLKDSYFLAETRSSLAETALEQGQPNEALELTQLARQPFVSQAYIDGELRALALGISSQVKLGNRTGLESALKEAEALWGRCESLLTRLESGIHLARGWQALGQSGRARKSLQEIRQQAADHGLVPLELEAMLALADLEEAEGRAIEAQDLRQEVSRRAETQRLGNLQRKADSGLAPG